MKSNDRWRRAIGAPLSRPGSVWRGRAILSSASWRRKSGFWVRRIPDATVTKSKRKGKVLIDYLRNGGGSAAVAPYSTRARPRPAISMPLEWAELSPAIGTAYFKVTNALPRLAALDADPWEDFGRRGTAGRREKVEAGGVTRRLRYHGRHFGRKRWPKQEIPYVSQRFLPRAKVAINAEHSGAYEDRPPC